MDVLVKELHQLLRKGTDGLESSKFHRCLKVCLFCYLFVVCLFIYKLYLIQIISDVFLLDINYALRKKLDEVAWKTMRSVFEPLRQQKTKISFKVLFIGNITYIL